MTIKISTADFTNSVEVEIDGQLFKVRKLGAGDQMDISVATNKFLEVSKRASNTQSKVDALKSLSEEENSEEIEKSMSEIQEIMDQTVLAQENLYKCYAKLFDDLGDGSKSLDLVKKVGIENVPKILAQVFGENDG